MTQHESLERSTASAPKGSTGALANSIEPGALKAAQLRAMSPRQLRALLRRCHPVDLAQLDDTEYRGLSLGLPGWADAVASRPCSSSLAAFQVSQRIDSVSMCISASLKAIPCFWAIAWSKARRSRRPVAWPISASAAFAALSSEEGVTAPG